MASLFSATRASSAATLSPSTSLSTDGVYQLQWAGDAPVEIEEATDPGFADARLLYRGSDTAAVVTGRTTGTYHYRLADAGGAQAGPLRVRVEPHPLSRALAFFGVGAVVFVATVLVVVRGAQEAGADG